MANNGRRVQSQVRVRTLHGGAHVRVLHPDQHADGAVHAELEPPEGVPGEPGTGQRDVHRAGQPGHVQPRGAGERGPRAGGRHDDLEDDVAEQHTDRIDHVRRVLERPEPEAEAVHADTHRRRADHNRGPDDMHILFLRAAHGSHRAGGVAPVSLDRRMDDYGHGYIQLHRRRVFGEISYA